MTTNQRESPMAAPSGSTNLQSLIASASACALIALAFFLRVFRLADKNIWWDEGWTLWMAQHDFAWIALRTASDEHPPLHYWLMKIWQAVFSSTGFSADAFAARFFSLVCGVLLVAIIYRLGKDIGGVRLGLLAALFAGLARFQVWWSQDIKNYTLSALFAWASVWFVWRWLFGAKLENKYLVGYVLCATLGLYSHYLAALIFLANNLFVAIVLLLRWRTRVGATLISASLAKVARDWMVAQIAVLALFAPWLYLYLQNGATWTAAPAFDFGLFLRLAATVLALGVTTYIENYTWVVLGLLFVAALSSGWIVARRRTDDDQPQSVLSAVVRPPPLLAWGSVYNLLIVLIPPALIYALSLTPAAIFAPKIQARYLLIITPAFALLLGLGVLLIADRIRWKYAPWVAAGLAACIVVAQLLTLTDYFQTRYLQDDYFSLAQMINNFGADQDAIVLNTDQEWPTFLYYLQKPIAWVGVPNGKVVDQKVAAQVAAMTLQAHAVWVVTIPDALAQDPQHLVEQAIARRLPKQYEQTFGDKRLTLYADTLRNVKDVASSNFSPQQPRADVFDDRLKLIGVDLPVRDAFAGDVVRVVTYWAAQDLTTINLALQTADGQTVAQASIPISIGAHERAEGDLQIPPNRNAGELHVVALARLRALPIGTVNVLPRGNDLNEPSDAPSEILNNRFGDSIHLVGVNLPQHSAQAGADLPLTLFWKTAAPVSTSYTVFVHLLGAQYNSAQNNFLWGQVDSIPLAGKLPTTAWAPQQTIADTYAIKIDDHAPPGLYKIEIGLYDAATGARLRVYDANGKDIGDAVVGDWSLELQ